MINLILCIISTSMIMVVFKIAGRRRIDPFNIIVINYFVGAILGFATGYDGGYPVPAGTWVLPSLITAFLFVAMFLVIGKATIRTGISVTTITTKMSVIIPVIFSIVYFNESVGITKLTGILLALIGVALSVYKPAGRKKLSYDLILYPLILFIGVGMIDSMLKYIQEAHGAGNFPLELSAFLFGVSALISVTLRILIPGIAKEKARWDTIPTGIILGLVNFGSVFFIISALEKTNLDSSIVFGINNLGVVTLSVLIASFIFGEKLSRLNMAGLIICLISLLFLFIA